MPVKEKMLALRSASYEVLFHVCFIFKVASQFFVNSWCAVS